MFPTYNNYYLHADTGRWWPVDVGHLMGAADPAAWAQAPVCARSMPLFPSKKLDHHHGAPHDHPVTSH